MGLPDWLAAQTAFFQLAEKVREKSIVPLLGAGMSMEASFPDWRGLTTCLLGKVQRAIAKHAAAGAVATQTIDASDMLIAADFARTHLGDAEFEAEIARLLEIKPAVEDRITRSANYKALARLDVPYWLTTNFDGALEAALTIHAKKKPRCIDWSDETELNAFLLSGKQEDDPVCVHLHGTIGRSNSLVFTERDYQRRYWRSDLDRVKLFLLFTTHCIVTIGFSLNDEDFLSILREIKAKLAFSEPRHFAILAAPPNEITERLEAGGKAAISKEKYGIAPIYFPLDNGVPHFADYAALGQLLEALHTVVAQEQKAAVSEAAADVSGDCPDDPQKGKWGGRPKRDGFELSAEVKENAHLEQWFDIRLKVQAPGGDAAAVSDAIFHLHSTFEPPNYTRPFVGGVAELVLTAYGAFTVGVLIERQSAPPIQLELDLAGEPEAPALFRSR